MLAHGAQNARQQAFIHGTGIIIFCAVCAAQLISIIGVQCTAEVRPLKNVRFRSRHEKSNNIFSRGGYRRIFDVRRYFNSREKKRL